MTEYEINKAEAEKLGIMQYMFDGKDSESIIWNVPSNNLYNGFVSSRGNYSIRATTYSRRGRLCLPMTLV